MKPLLLLAPLTALALALPGAAVAGTVPVGSAAGPAATGAGAVERGVGAAAVRKPLAGVVVGLDAGHNGRWSPALNRPVDAGFGMRKPCNTSGTSTASGYAEHSHNLDVALRVRGQLQSLGATVVMTRTSDTGVGPCIDLRSRTLSSHHTTLNVSIHADGNRARTARGFHVIRGTRAAGGRTVVTGSSRLALAVRDGYQRATGLPRSTYLGGGSGITPRRDLAFTNLATAPSVMVEAGNMRHPRDAVLLRSAAFRQREADGIVRGIRSYLHR